MLKHKPRINHAFPLEIKSMADDGSFEGYLAVFGNEDLAGDIIVKGAFSKTLAENSEFPLLWKHNMDEPIGSFTAVQDENGLLIKGQLVLDDAVPLACKSYALMKARALKGLSVGMFVVKHAFQGAVRRITEAALIEGSVTPVPMNPLATVLSVKDEGSPIAVNEKFLTAMKGFIPTVVTEIDPNLDYWMNMAKIMRNRELQALSSFRYDIHSALNTVCDEILLYDDTLTAEQKAAIFSDAMALHAQYMQAWFDEMMTRTMSDASAVKAALIPPALTPTQPVVEKSATPSESEPQSPSADAVFAQRLVGDMKLTLAMMED